MATQLLKKLQFQEMSFRIKHEKAEAAFSVKARTFMHFSAQQKSYYYITAGC
jgi:hypothetical protein